MSDALDMLARSYCAGIVDARDVSCLDLEDEAASCFRFWYAPPALQC